MSIVANSTKLKFILVRAGSTDLDIQGRILGSLDLPLCESGMLEAQLTNEELNGLRIDAIYSSAGMAAKQTAQQLSHNGKVRIRVDEKLTNLDCGLWQGKTIDELRETQPTLLRKWREHPELICPPKGETVDSVRVRVENLLKKIRRKHRTGTVVIVAPDPLLSVIRREITPKSIPCPKIDPTKSSDWKMVETLEAAG